MKKEQLTSHCYPYPRPALTVDIAVLSLPVTLVIGQDTNSNNITSSDNKFLNSPIDIDNVSVLLIQRGRPPFEGSWALPGGFVDELEPLEHAALRELQEETNISGLTLQLFSVYGDPGRDPRGWTVSIVYLGLLHSNFLATAGDDARSLDWFPLQNLPPLAFDHAQILNDIRSRLIDNGIGNETRFFAWLNRNKVEKNI